jgi:hypothetical protein
MIVALFLVCVLLPKILHYDGKAGEESIVYAIPIATFRPFIIITLMFKNFLLENFTVLRNFMKRQFT